MSEYVNYDGLKRYDELIKNVISVKTWIGSCSTAAGTAAKVISVESGFKLLKGVRIGVKFTATNTASNVTLNINNTGAKSIYYNNTVYTGTSNMICGYANRYVFYVYDGTNWVWDGYSNHDNTSYSAMSTEELTTGTATNSRVVRSDYLKAGIKSIVEGYGYTTNTGTVTSVAVKMNNTTKGTVTTGGTIDLGTVITSHQDISGKVDKTTTVNGHALSSNVTVTKSDVGLGNVGNFKAVSTEASQGLTDTEKSNARTNIGAGTSSFSGSYNDLSNKPTIPAAAANGTYTIKTLVGSTTTNVSDFTANQSSADDVTFVQGSNVTITPDATNRKITIAATDTTYSSKAAVSGGTDVSLVTTGEKATWNAKTSNTGTITGIKMNGASKGTSGVVDLGTVITSLNHTVTVQSGLKSDGTTTISGTSSSAGSPTVALGDSGVTAGTYKRVTVNAKGIVIGGDNSDSNTLNTTGTTNKTGTKMFLTAATELSANPVTYSNSNCYIGTDNCLYSGGNKVLTSETYTGTVTGVKVGTTSYSPSSGIVTIPAYPTTLPASDVSSWAKASTKPSYNYSEIGYTATETTSAGGAISIDGTIPLQVITISAAVSSITFSAVPENGHSCHLIITASSALSVAIAHGATMYTGYTSVCPEATDISLDITAGGYIELDLLRVGTKIYVRGV